MLNLLRKYLSGWPAGFPQVTLFCSLWALFGGHQSQIQVIITNEYKYKLIMTPTIVTFAEGFLCAVTLPITSQISLINKVLPARHQKTWVLALALPLNCVVLEKFLHHLDLWVLFLVFLICKIRGWTRSVDSKHFCLSNRTVFNTHIYQGIKADISDRRSWSCTCTPDT